MRAFGRQLKIHEELIGRHPFPGPGLGIRIIGEVTRERVEIVRQADHIFISMIREAGIYDEVRRHQVPPSRRGLLTREFRSPKPTPRLIRAEVNSSFLHLYLRTCSDF